MLFKRVCSLGADKRWALTGTPIHNRIGDLGSLLQFVRVPGLNSAEAFKKHVIDVLKDSSRAERAKEVSDTLVAVFSLRRTRAEVFTGGDQLPGIRFDDVRERLGKIDALVYNNIATSLLATLDDVSTAAPRAYAFAKLMLLRRLCAGGRNILVDPDQYLPTGATATKPVCIDTDDDGGGGGSSRPMLPTEAAARVHFEVQLSNSHSECVVCAGEIDTDGDEPSPVGFAAKMCGHLWCTACLHAAAPGPGGLPSAAAGGLCGHCSAIRGLGDVWPIHNTQPDATATPPAAADFVKIGSILQDLEYVRARNVCRGGAPEKVLVFSTWTATLDVVEALARQRGFGCVRIDGRRSLAARRAAVGRFRDNDECMVMFLTLGAGSEGLTLTRANHVMFMDRSYNPAVEEQAISRVYRPGQTRKVTVKRYIMAGTVEERVGQLQESKQALAEMTLCGLGKSTKDWTEAMKEVVSLLK